MTTVLSLVEEYEDLKKWMQDNLVDSAGARLEMLQGNYADQVLKKFNKDSYRN